nr:hypothetical protein Iba_chr08eCG7580 [Ipomoea batatas]GMD28461.1 hypothetical protein Iba_chr08eCG7590 [Ipomoea batatas]
MCSSSPRRVELRQGIAERRRDGGKGMFDAVDGSPTVFPVGEDEVSVLLLQWRILEKTTALFFTGERTDCSEKTNSV